MNVPLPPRRWVTRLGVPAALGAATIAVLAWASWSSLVPAVTVDAVPVVTRASIETDAAVPVASASVQAAGWIEPAPFPIAVTALASGVVSEVLVLEGEPVRRGDVVARLVREDAVIAVESARAELARRVAMHVAATAALTRAEAVRASLVDSRRQVAVAEARATAARAAVEMLRADLAAAESELRVSTDQATRIEAAAGGGGISEAERVRTRERVATAQAAVDGLHARRRMLEAAVAEADADLVAARANSELLIAETAEVATARAETDAAEAERVLAESQLARAELDLERTEVRAPVDGVVLERLAVPGTMVGDASSMPIVHLYDPSSLQVRADVANADIALVGVGMPASITVESLPDRTLSGTVTRIVGLADIQKNTVQVKIRIDQPPATLRPDMLCRVRLGAGSEPGDGRRASRLRMLAPRALIEGTSVSVVGPLHESVGRVERRSVVLGTSQGDWIEVLNGLRPGDLLVDPALEEGTRVRPRAGGTHATP